MLQQESPTRERLREAAWHLVRDHGLAAATSRRITEVAGANLAAITYHYGSKDVLIGDALVHQLREWTAPLTAALTHAGPDRDRRKSDAVRTILATFATRSDEAHAILRAVMTNEQLPGVQDAVATWLGEFRQLVSRVIADEQQAGTVPPTVDPHAMAAVFTAFGIGIGAQAAIDKTAPDTDSVVFQFLALLADASGQG